MEELKLIMQTLTGLGETAKEGFIWWLVIDKLVPTILLGIFGGGLISLGIFVAKKVSDAANNTALAEAEKDGARQTISTIRGILGIYTFPNSKQDSSPVYYGRQEFQETIDAVRARKEAAERNSPPSSAV